MPGGPVGDPWAVAGTGGGRDGLVDGAGSTTRAIPVTARAEQVWPWLVQIGYGRAGWYSYDWIDNDGRPSADRILPDFQYLRVGSGRRWDGRHCRSSRSCTSRRA